MPQSEIWRVGDLAWIITARWGRVGCVVREPGTAVDFLGVVRVFVQCLPVEDVPPRVIYVWPQFMERFVPAPQK